MPNEVIFLGMMLVVLSATLGAFRLGKHWLFGLIAVNIVLANIFVTKQFQIFGMVATGGNITYGSIFLATDMLCEHYGPHEGRRAVLLGFAAALFYLITSQFMLLLAPAASDLADPGMRIIFAFAPRIILASMTAYLISQFHDVWFYHLIRSKTGSRKLWLRNNASTWVSQLFDSVVFTGVAFGGVFSGSVLLQIVVTTYLLKVLVAAVDTPFIYLSNHFKPPELRRTVQD